MHLAKTRAQVHLFIDRNAEGSCCQLSSEVACSVFVSEIRIMPRTEREAGTFEYKFLCDKVFLFVHF